jgi:hypothetical protein
MTRDIGLSCREGPWPSVQCHGGPWCATLPCMFKGTHAALVAHPVALAIALVVIVARLVLDRVAPRLFPGRRAQ